VLDKKAYRKKGLPLVGSPDFHEEAPGTNLWVENRYNRKPQGKTK